MMVKFSSKGKRVKLLGCSYVKLDVMLSHSNGMKKGGIYEKIWTLLFAVILIVPLVLRPATAQAAKAITINVDGVQLKPISHQR